jgi:hypothetical protein
MLRYFSVAVTWLALSIAGPLTIAAEEPNKIPSDLQTALEKAEQFELLSISPDRLKEKPADAFHGWKVLGKTTVKDAVRQKLVTDFKKGVEANKGIVAACFNPRHGIRVTHGGKTADFVICFECYQVQAYVGDKPVGGFLITDLPQETFNIVLKEAKIPLSEKPKP